MRDSAFNRAFKAILYLTLVMATITGILWSLMQTIQFSIPVMQDEFIGTILGIIIQLSPTACLYMASSYNKGKKDEWGRWIMWLSAFWVISAMDAATNVGARFDRISMNKDFDFGANGFANPEFAIWANRIGVALGILIDLGIVFGEEVLGHFVSIFFDNFGEALRLFGQEPPEWFSMVSTDRNRAIGGKGHRGQGRGGNEKGRPNQNSSRNQPPDRGKRHHPGNRGRDSRGRGRGRGRDVTGRRPNNVRIMDAIEERGDHGY